MMWLFSIYITLVGFYVKSKAECYCGTDNILNELYKRINQVDEIIEFIKKQHNTITQQKYNYERAINKATIVLNKLENINNYNENNNLFDDNNNDIQLTDDMNNLSWKQDSIINEDIDDPIARRFLKTDGKKWNKQFYTALAKSLQKEFVKQPVLRENLGENFDVHKYIVKDE